ncbi:hypothetical protein [Serratia sp. CY85251]|uniref:hypothetical protein n=1 Tax=Serratia sp. CY85251 TaxID=3383696 RepID=UPI003FA0B85E
MKDKPMKDEDLDRCPQCKEDMWAGNALCETCRWEKDMDDAPGGNGAALAAPNGGDCHHETR